MAGSVNKVFLIGNLGRDPEIRRTQSGDRIARARKGKAEASARRRETQTVLI